MIDSSLNGKLKANILSEMEAITAYTVDSVETADTVETVDTVYTDDTVYTVDTVDTVERY